MKRLYVIMKIRIVLMKITLMIIEIAVRAKSLLSDTITQT